MTPGSPLVSIVTPVYNGGKYLAECLESVLAQTYDHWDYTIVNNCSTDKTLEIAERYARGDQRIRVLTNSHFVNAIANHNNAFRQISPRSVYCKLISADDWIYPECIEKLVELAERNPTVGIVQCYAINRYGVRWTGIPYDAIVLRGCEVGRLYLLGKMEFASIPSSILYRSSLVRSRDPFFPGNNASSDAAACLDSLQACDFGMVHQILSFQRFHDETETATALKLDSYLVDRLGMLLKYGPVFLTAQELDDRLEEMLQDYFTVLAARAVNYRSMAYWKYHKARLAELGFSLYGKRFAKALSLKLLDLALNPKQTVERILKRASEGEQLNRIFEPMSVAQESKTSVLP